MTPTVGSIVHYYDREGAGPFAAIITDVTKGRATLYVLFKSGQHHVTHDAAQADTPTPSTWMWPPREAEASEASEAPAETASTAAPASKRARKEKATSEQA